MEEHQNYLAPNFSHTQFLPSLLQVENQVSTYDPHGYMVVYAVDDEESLATAERVLNYLKNMEIVHGHAVILVANKTDLVRSRVVGPAGTDRVERETEIGF